jgi:hypothetical protein
MVAFSGTETYSITYEEYIYRIRGRCYFKVLLSSNNWTLGTSFFRQYYSVFDAEEGRVGLAQVSPRIEPVFTFVFTVASLSIVFTLAVILRIGCLMCMIEKGPRPG